MNHDTPRKILLIEDNPVDVSLFKEYLERTEKVKTELTVTNLFADALGYLGFNRFDLIILDLGLPDVIGTEGIEYLKKSIPNTPLIILTGCEDPEVGMNAIQLGAQDYLIKGKFDAFLLDKSIGYAIERHKLYLEMKNINLQLTNNIKQLELTNNALLNSRESVICYKNELETLRLKFAS